LVTRAAAAAEAPYFFEALVWFSQQTIPHGDGYEDWRRGRADAMSSGREIYCCGQPT
jgi:hypothetical protein